MSAEHGSRYWRRPDETPRARASRELAAVLVRMDERSYALADRCSHRGCRHHRGKLNSDETLTCAGHGSTFRLDGSIVTGPAASPQPALDVRTNKGPIEIRRSHRARPHDASCLH